MKNQTVSEIKQEYFNALQDLDEVRIYDLANEEDAFVVDLLYDRAETLAALFADLEVMRS